MSSLIPVSFCERPELLDEAIPVLQAGWARFWMEDPVSKPLWPSLIETFSDYHFGLYDEETGQLAGVGMTAPLAWDGAGGTLLDRGWHWVLQQSLEDFHAGRTGRTLSAINAVIMPAFRGRGLAEALVLEMRQVARRHGLRRFIAPLRPTQKERYPLLSIQQYLAWRRPDGEPFDAWLRVQTRLGAEILGVAERSICIEAPLTDWTTWTGLEFPYSGLYIVPGAAVPLEANLDLGRGVLISPSIWIQATDL